VYDKALVSGSAATLATLPMTGFSVVWFVIAAFALMMAGGALLRTLPKKHS
jgi:LPXTG-motif cell wall-anchored protein